MGGGGGYNWKRFSVIRQMVEGGWGATFKLDFTVVENNNNNNNSRFLKTHKTIVSMLFTIR